MVDEHALTELLFHVDNTQYLNSRKLDVFERLARRREAGGYDPSKAPKAFSALLMSAAKDYKSEHGSMADRWHDLFPAAVRRAAEQHLARMSDAWFALDWLEGGERERRM